MTVTSALTLHTADASSTQALAEAIAAAFLPGDVVALSGELGAGKTCFVQGAARGLDIEVPVTSPTFVLIRQYRGRLPIVHADVYRLNRMQDVFDLGDEVFAPDVVTFVEWGDAIASVLPSDRLDVEILHAEDLTAETQPVDDGSVPPAPRTVVLRTHGSWGERHQELATLCAPWREG